MRLIKAAARIKFLEPRIKKLPLLLMNLSSYFYVRYVEGIKVIDDENIGTLISSFKDFQDDKIKLLIAFRHPAKHDPPLLIHLMNRRLKKRARKINIDLNRRSHSHFVYGSWVLTWANRQVKWLFPGIGAIPVSSRGRDIKGIKEIRKLLLKSTFPIAMAPEGQVTYHNQKCGELEPGIISIAGWCKEDLEKEKIDQKVIILPLTTHYDYGEDQDKVLRKLKIMLNRKISSNIPLTSDHYADSLVFTDKVISTVETYYKRYHHFLPDKDSSVDGRIYTLCDYILRIGEKYFKLNSTGSFLNRVLTIRETGASRISLNEIDNLSKLSLLQRDLADHMASETVSVLRHMELADILIYIDTTYISVCSCKNRHIEYLLNLLDVINRLNGGTIATRFSSIKKKVKIISGKPIEYKKTISRSEKKEQMSSLTKQLYDELTRISR